MQTAACTMYDFPADKSQPQRRLTGCTLGRADCSVIHCKSVLKEREAIFTSFPPLNQFLGLCLCCCRLSLLVSFLFFSVMVVYRVRVHLIKSKMFSLLFDAGQVTYSEFIRARLLIVEIQSYYKPCVCTSGLVAFIWSDYLNLNPVSSHPDCRFKCGLRSRKYV